MKKNKKLKRLSLANLIAGYIMLCSFILLVLANRADSERLTETNQIAEEGLSDNDLFNGVHSLRKEDKADRNKDVLYVNSHPVEVYSDQTVYRDRSHGVILNSGRDDIAVVRGDVDRAVLIDGRDSLDREIYNEEIRITGRDLDIMETDLDVGNIRREHFGNDIITKRDLRDGAPKGVDAGLLDRRLAEQDSVGVVDVDALDLAIKESDEDKFGIDGEELAGLTLARDDENADFELDVDSLKAEGLGSKGYGLDKGDLYAYNFPSQGVGAGIGSGAVGAGAGGGAGIGAGIGEAVLQGQSVPTLGGVGTSGPPPMEGQPADGPPSDGVGGLVSGAGTGGAAGLVTGTVSEKLGLGVSVGEGGGGAGAGYGGGYNYDHLPRDGALHIMIHVDGSGSILSTRKQLDIMKDTLLKQALLPYYNNDEDLYNRRVTILDDSGERTLQFFTEAAEEGNVLAVAFQDEAAPDYHLPNFNRHPQDAYSSDLGKLKSRLNGYGGLYRGIMFQVDRGNTFAKSFKELVECAWRGEGYLKGSSLKKYHRDNNLHHIKNKDGIVFSDEYHAKSEGDPQYYLDLLFNASKRVGLDLNIYGAGLTDGESVEGE
tara:strand:+ start:1252 stop:3048 length:1797 start_codon:yes stop_codon:yes gene_type:complete